MYQKFHWELNYIECFWYNGKNWIRRNCKYSIEGLRDDILKALAQVKGSTILGHYKSCLKKIDKRKYNTGLGSGRNSHLIKKLGR